MTLRIVGWSGIYIGLKYPHLRQRRVSIVAVRRALAELEGPIRITSNEELAGLGGIAVTDRIDIAPALESGRLGETARDVAIEDLDNAHWIFNPPPSGSHEG